QDIFTHIRKMATYPKADVFIICFAVNDMKSYDNAYQKWHSEIDVKVSKIPIILVGTKSDLRNDSSAPKLVPYKTAADQVSFGHYSKYVECSTKNMTNIKEVFEAAAREYISVKSKQGCGCNIQ
ncbi:MAG: hypothetical protein EZS28_041561, partial [Streblomastix strix]